MSKSTNLNINLGRQVRLRLSPYQMVRTDWLAKAAVLPGRTLHYAMAVFMLATIANSSTVSPGPKTLEKYGVSTDSSSDALARLIAAGLVRADRKRGRAPRITLLEGPDKLLALRKEIAGVA